MTGITGCWPAWLAMALGVGGASVSAAWAGNQALTAGLYGATLGAGGATAAERSAFGQNPAAVEPMRAGGMLHFHRPFGLEEIQVAEAAGFWDFRRAGFALGWRQTGVDGLYQEDGWSFNPSLRIGSGEGLPGELTLGAALILWQSAMPGFRSQAWGRGLGWTWRPHPQVKLGGFALDAPLRAPGAPGPDAVWQGGLELSSRAPSRPTTSYAARQTFRLDARKTGHTPWRTLASLTVSPHASVDLSGGLSTAPFQVSLGLALQFAGFRLHPAFRYHRYLGRTLLSTVGFSRARP